MKDIIPAAPSQEEINKAFGKKSADRSYEAAVIEVLGRENGEACIRLQDRIEARTDLNVLEKQRLATRNLYLWTGDIMTREGQKNVSKIFKAMARIKKEMKKQNV